MSIDGVVPEPRVAHFHDCVSVAPSHRALTNLPQKAQVDTVTYEQPAAVKYLSVSLAEFDTSKVVVAHISSLLESKPKPVYCNMMLSKQERALTALLPIIAVLECTNTFSSSTFEAMFANAEHSPNKEFESCLATLYLQTHRRKIRESNTHDHAFGIYHIAEQRKTCCWSISAFVSATTSRRAEFESDFREIKKANNWEGVILYQSSSCSIMHQTSKERRRDTITEIDNQAYR